jgi:hypothetical protein
MLLMSRKAQSLTGKMGTVIRGSSLMKRLVYFSVSLSSWSIPYRTADVILRLPVLFLLLDMLGEQLLTRFRDAVQVEAVAMTGNLGLIISKFHMSVSK